MLNHPIFEAIGWTLVHSLWQATLVGILFFIGYHALSRYSAKRRFELAGLALLSQLMISLSTLLILIESPAAGQTALSALTVNMSETVAASPSLSNWIPVITLFWALGALIAISRIVLGYFQTKQICREGQMMDSIWIEKCQVFAKRLGLRKPIQVLQHVACQVPMTVQHLKPVILFPIGFVNQLSPEETEAILAHELAHIKRNDFIL
ncbi:MAG: M56 family metallopeptidase, partial [Saprospiraceae bacterium]|nr:M56 family metallopeptidase [Saprospiraceae bacterium]